MDSSSDSPVFKVSDVSPSRVTLDQSLSIEEIVVVFIYD